MSFEHTAQNCWGQETQLWSFRTKLNVFKQCLKYNEIIFDSKNNHNTTLKNSNGCTNETVTLAIFFSQVLDKENLAQSHYF